MALFNLLKSNETSITCEDEWLIEIETDPDSEEKMITLWILAPDGERHHFLTICGECLPSLHRVVEKVAVELEQTV